MQVAREFANEVLTRLSVHPGLRASVVEHAVRDSIELLVSTDVGHAQQRHPSFRYAQVHAVPAAWTSQWWARFIRWLCQLRIGGRWRLPMPRICRVLAYAQETIYQPVTIDVPIETHERVIAQIEHMRLRNEEPGKILCGHGALRGLQQLPRLAHFPSQSPHGWADLVLFGLPVQLCEWLADDTVVVC